MLAVPAAVAKHMLCGGADEYAKTKERNHAVEGKPATHRKFKLVVKAHDAEWEAERKDERCNKHTEGKMIDASERVAEDGAHAAHVAAPGVEEVVITITKIGK